MLRREDAPSQVVQRIRRGEVGSWSELGPEAAALAVAKLRLAGVYDDRQEGRFMLRTRVPGGQLAAEQADVVALVARDYAVAPHGEEGPQRFAEITTRQDLQLHWIRFEDLPAIWARYEAVGLTSLQACGDTVRNLTTCAAAGLDPDELLDVRPLLRRLDELALARPELSAFLPRKFKIALTGSRHDCVSARLQDLAFTPARGRRGLGFNVHAGGGLSDYPRLASPLDLHVAPDEVPAAVTAVLQLYRERGDPEHKAVNRFRMLVHQLGPPQVEREIRARLPFAPEGAGEDLSTWRPEDHLGIRAAAGGSHYAGLCVPLGRLGWSDLAEVARVAGRHGDGSIRLTQRQNLILAGIREPEPLLAEPLLRRLRSDPDPFERALVACTSAPFCKFGLVDAKAFGAGLAERLRASVPREAWPRLQGLRLHVGGCKASCAQVHAAHIGLRGTMAGNDDGYVEAFDVALGGRPGRLGAWAALAVPADEAGQACAGLLRALAEDGETPDAIDLASGSWFGGERDA